MKPIVVAYLIEASQGAPFFAQSCVIHSYPRHRRVDYFDMMAITAGGGRVVKFFPDGGTKAIRLRAGQMVMFRPSDEIRLVGDPGEGMDVFHIAFPASDWQSFASLVNLHHEWLTSSDPPTARFDLDDSEALRPFRVALDRFHQSPTIYDLVTFWTGVIPRFFPVRAGLASSVATPRWLTDTLEAMRSEENLRAGLPRFLEIAHVSRTHLYASVRRYLGKSPSALITQMRVRHAAVLLATAPESVAEIARRCGFASTTYFSTSFRNEHHLSPREYRARARSGPRGLSRGHDL